MEAFSPSPEENRIKALTVVPYFGAELRDDQWRNKKIGVLQAKSAKQKSVADNDTINIWQDTRKENNVLETSMFKNGERKLRNKEICTDKVTEVAIQEANLYRSRGRTSKKEGQKRQPTCFPPEFSATGFPCHIMWSHVNMPPLAT